MRAAGGPFLGRFLTRVQSWVLCHADDLGFENLPGGRRAEPSPRASTAFDATGVEGPALKLRSPSRHRRRLRLLAASTYTTSILTTSRGVTMSVRETRAPNHPSAW